MIRDAPPQTTGETPSHPAALIAGGSGVIGRRISHTFARHEWNVGVQCFRNREAANGLFESHGDHEAPLTLYDADIRCPTEVENMVSAFHTRYGRLDALIYAIGLARDRLLVRLTPHDWNEVMATNLTGCYRLLHATAPYFERQGHGTVIIVGSLSAHDGSAGQTAYAASKAGLEGMMKCVAAEWAAWNVRINVVFPGWHASPLTSGRVQDSQHRKRQLLDRAPSLEQVAASLYALATLPYVTGQVVNLDNRLL